jgi:predicted nuclease of restriction endonuclease-like RecB superfamily
MLTGNLVLTRNQKQRIVPRYLDPGRGPWLEIAAQLTDIFARNVGNTRGQIEEEVEEFARAEAGAAALVYRGLAKVLEDRAEFEVVADVPPETLREKVFAAAAAERKTLHEGGRRAAFRADAVLARVADELKIPPAQITASLFADLKDENRLLAFDPMEPRALLDRYNVALAQAVLLRCVRMRLEVRNETPAEYRQFFRWLKFHRLLHRAEGSAAEGYRLEVDGPLSLFSATTRYGLQFALFLPAILLCRRFRLEAELSWGPRREARSFYLDSDVGLVSHYQPRGQYVPAEVNAFVERFKQIAAAWDVEPCGDVIELGREGVWVPDYRFVHRATGLDVHVEVLGFWKRSALDRLLRLLPLHGPSRYLLAVSDRLKVDEGAAGELPASIVRFKEIPNATEVLSRLERMVAEAR